MEVRLLKMKNYSLQTQSMLANVCSLCIQNYPIYLKKYYIIVHILIVNILYPITESLYADQIVLIDIKSKKVQKKPC